MKKSIYTIIVALTVLLGGKAFAQQDAQFSNYMFNGMYLNPAYAGMDGAPRFLLIHRSQWAGYSGVDGSGGAPQTQAFTFNAPILRINSGVGVHLVNDQIGAWNNMEAQVSISHHFQIANGKLGLGLRGGVYGKSVNTSILRWRQPGDPLEGASESQFRPDMAVGAWYRTEKYYGGVAVNHLLRTKFDLGVPADRTLGNALEPHLNITGGYNFEVSYSLVLTPSMLIKSDFNKTSFEASGIATYNERFWGGLSYRQQDAVIVMAGFSMLKDNALRFGYAFDYTIPQAEAKKPTSHEVFVTYTLPSVVVGSKPIIRTPRFRH